MENVKHNGVKLGLYDTQWMNCVNDPQVLAWDTSKEDAVNRAVELAEKYCIENAKKAIDAAEQAQPPAVTGRDAIRRIFMAHGFTIKEGQTDMKPYVYEAAEALLRELSPAVAVSAEMTPDMMRAVQLRSELGAYAAANLSGAYDLFADFWRVAVEEAQKCGA